ncbi:hypothetical protein A3A55_00435 [Candidatus Roizmanbacteria bacterium RIFCSPLOWO2_01_FULL_40_14]|nr:MAG: hypothetical protein A3A55_00435 [Candidatus Roizmanbacteria bacterium RIFCSPLOWO2_01_FULL_40_14]
MSQKVEELFNEMSPINDRFTQSSTLAYLWTRVAAGLETYEGTREMVGLLGTSATWNRANYFLFDLIEQNLHQALTEAISLTLIPSVMDKNREQINKWMRTSGLALLGADEFIDSLNEYLSQKRGYDLSDALLTFIRTDVSDLRTAEDMSHHPEGFSTVQATYIALALGESASGQFLYETARNRLFDPDFQHTATIIRQFSDCKYLDNRLPTF